MKRWPKPNPRAIAAFRDPDKIWKDAVSRKIHPDSWLDIPSAGEIPDEALDLIRFLIPQVLLRFTGFSGDPFKMVSGERTPLLREPNCLKVTLPQRAHEILRWAFAEEAMAEEIFSRSRFEDGDRRYRTDFSDTGLGIFGESNKEFRSLASLCHELGHALVETKTGHQDDLPGKVKSETTAQIFEFRIGEAYLGPKELEQWRLYQSSVDELNYYFFLWESARLGFLSKEQVPHGMNYFADPYLFFRETLFTGTGYQAIYAAASLRRESALGFSAIQM